MPDLKYKLHSSEIFFWKISDQEFIKEELVESLGNRATAFKKYQKYESKWKRELKGLKKHNKMLFSMSNWSGSRHELNVKNKIRSKSSKKYDSFSSDISSSDDDYSLSSSSEWDKRRQPAKRK